MIGVDSLGEFSPGNFSGYE